ncbi:MAG: hypothetical protein SFZ23_11735 [Planctomycetota bacterium]|nr:hypothetical protein [Planctomycetota bacterium]
MTKNASRLASVLIGSLVLASGTGAALGAAAPAWVALPLVAAPALASTALAEDAITQEGIIAGTMDIQFTTRTNLDASGDLREGSAAIGAQDTYKFTINVAQTTEFSGTIKRQPNLYTKNLGRRKQDALLSYDVGLAVLNPRDLKQKRVVGKWVGTVPIDTTTGAFDLAGGKAKQSPLRIAIDTAGSVSGFTEEFGGKLVGKAEKKDTLAQYTFKRVVGNREITKVISKSDPMRFENIILAKGPSPNYPRTTVSGRLDYDYETGNWYTDGIRFAYTLDSQEFVDVVTGSIKWVEDPERQANGKGYYEFNLRFNEDKHRKAGTEGDAFAAMSEEDAFFAVDDSVPALTGRVEYVDTMGGNDLPASSKVTYKLNANKLTKQQAMNFFKLWLIGIGPINDE